MAGICKQNAVIYKRRNAAPPIGQIPTGLKKLAKNESCFAP
jgi:hypothetical protein